MKLSTSLWKLTKPSWLPTSASAFFLSLWMRYEQAILALLLGFAILCLLLSAGCAELPPAAPPTSACHVPTIGLQPTPEPQMMDATNQDLLTDNQQVREALRLANGDKARTLNYIQRNCK